MALVTVNDLEIGIRGLLHDEQSDTFRWTREKITRHINDGSLEIVRLRPDANAVRQALQLTALATAQSVLPAEGLAVVDVIRNMGPAGTTPGRAIMRTTREALDRADPLWHNTTANKDIRQWARIDEQIENFWAYPPPTDQSNVFVEVLYAAKPDRMLIQDFATTDVNTGTDSITLTGHGLKAGSEIQIITTDTLPAPLALLTTYFVLVTDADTIQLAATLGGAAIVLTTVGVGTHTLHSIITIVDRYQLQLQLWAAGMALNEDRRPGEPGLGERFITQFYTSLGVERA